MGIPTTKLSKLRNARQVLLHSDRTADGIQEIMGAAQLADLSNAFLLSYHLFEAVRDEMKGDHGHFSIESYQRVRKVLSDIGEVIRKASMGSRVSNLRIQLSIMHKSSLLEICTAFKKFSHSDVEHASDDDINMWKRIPPHVRVCLYEGLREVISNGPQPECALVEDVEYVLSLIGSNRSVLWPPKKQEEGLQQPESGVHQNLVHINGVDANDLSRAQRRELI